jgi:hypothetical protein
MDTGYHANQTSFKEGHVGMGGRPKGSRNKVQVDLARLIVQAATNTGFVTIDKDGKPIAGPRGTLGYLEWAALNQPKTFLGLLGRVLPYHIIETLPENRILSREQAIEEIKERGLPPALMAMLLQAAPPPKLDPDEDPDPYGVIKDVTPVQADDTAGTAGDTNGVTKE